MFTFGFLNSFCSVPIRVVLAAETTVFFTDNVSIPCSTVGSPVANNRTWYRVLDNGERVFLGEDTLVLKQVQSFQTGRYYCFADNGLTSDVQSTYIRVERKLSNIMLWNWFSFIAFWKPDRRHLGVWVGILCICRNARTPARSNTHKRTHPHTDKHTYTHARTHTHAHIHTHCTALRLAFVLELQPGLICLQNWLPNC